MILGENSPGYTAEGEIISTQTVSSKTRTVETITVSLMKLFNDGWDLTFISVDYFFFNEDKIINRFVKRIEQKYCDD